MRFTFRLSLYFVYHTRKINIYSDILSVSFTGLPSQPVKKKWFRYSPLQRINTGELGRLLEDHPDRKLVKYLLDGYKNGFKLGLMHLPKSRPPCKNPREALQKPEIVQELIDKELKLGHMLGPFDKPPFTEMVYSPINVVPKASSQNKYRLIHDLKHPYNDESINSCIPEENFTVQYHRIDEVIEMALAIGTCVKGALCNIEAAFHHQSMHFSQLFLLGFTFKGNSTSIPASRLVPHRVVRYSRK